jgi:hypothetical protein
VRGFGEKSVTTPGSVNHFFLLLFTNNTNFSNDYNVMSPGVRASPIDRSTHSTQLIIIYVTNMNHQPYKTPLFRQPLRTAACLSTLRAGGTRRLHVELVHGHLFPC